MWFIEPDKHLWRLSPFNDQTTMHNSSLEGNRLIPYNRYSGIDPMLINLVHPQDIRIRCYHGHDHRVLESALMPVIQHILPHKPSLGEFGLRVCNQRLNGSS